MELKLLNPAFYTKEFGIENEIKSFLLEITDYFSRKEYSEIINKITIVTAIAPNEEYEKGLWKEEVKVWPKSHDSFVCGRICFDAYHNSKIEKKKELIIIHILKSVKKLEKKGKMNYCAFEEDLKQFCKNRGIDVELD